MKPRSAVHGPSRVDRRHISRETKPRVEARETTPPSDLEGTASNRDSASNKTADTALPYEGMSDLSQTCAPLISAQSPKIGCWTLSSAVRVRCWLSFADPFLPPPIPRAGTAATTKAYKPSSTLSTTRVSGTRLSLLPRALSSRELSKPLALTPSTRSLSPSFGRWNRRRLETVRWFCMGSTKARLRN